MRYGNYWLDRVVLTPYSTQFHKGVVVTVFKLDSEVNVFCDFFETLTLATAWIQENITEGATNA